MCCAAPCRARKLKSLFCCKALSPQINFEFKAHMEGVWKIKAPDLLLNTGRDRMQDYKAPDEHVT